MATKSSALPHPMLPYVNRRNSLNKTVVRLKSQVSRLRWFLIVLLLYALWQSGVAVSFDCPIGPHYFASRMVTTQLVDLPSNFSVLFALEDVSLISQASKPACIMQKQNLEAVLVALNHSAEADAPIIHNIYSSNDCALHTFTLSSHMHQEKVVKALQSIAGPSEIEVVIDTFQTHNIHGRIAADAIHIQMPLADVAFSDWMGTLTLKEWKSWHTPKFDLAIITQSRTASLQRLLESLRNAAYFGSSAALRFNVDAGGTNSTLQLVENFTWPHGDKQILFRNQNVGLISAITESWYPNDLDSYVMIFEDDIEVSPWFFAWAKWTILRYRYGREAHLMKNVIGISLYNQQSTEMRTEGPIYEFKLAKSEEFGKQNIHNADSPYLSQVVCSWGSIFLPEGWRDFRRWLSKRLAKEIHHGPTSSPEIMSAFWGASWKKYFHEIEILKGYVNLYPNHPNGTSLSTNHVEKGVHHAHSLPKWVKSDRRPDLLASNTSILEGMPIGKLGYADLPSLSQLPLLDFRGYAITREQIDEKAIKAREQIKYEDTITDLPEPQDA